MRTLVVSDLHLGSRRGSDLLRRPELRAPLAEAAAGVNRVVLLGDAFELRDSPHRSVLAVAGAMVRELGEALGPHGELVVLGGNHDHGLVAGWMDARLETEPPGFLGLETRIDPSHAGPLAAAVADLARPATLSLAYPGIWLRDDVYALHGHYCDLHSTIPTFERLAAGAMARWVVRLPDRDATPDDYEAAVAPLYAWMHQLTQRSDRALLAEGAGASARAWLALTSSRGRRTPSGFALGAAYRAGVGMVNRVGLGPVEHRLSGAALRRGGLYGIGEVVRRLGIDADYVLWGHSHRAGPFPGDDSSEWRAPTGARILNTGSWVYQPHFLSERPNESPYWPGTAILVEDAGPPSLIRLLGDLGHPELAAPA